MSEVESNWFFLSTFFGELHHVNLHKPPTEQKTLISELQSERFITRSAGHPVCGEQREERGKCADYVTGEREGLAAG